MSVRRAAQSLAQLGLTRGIRTSAAARGGKGDAPNHDLIVYGPGTHGIQPGYNYDWEHGPHYLRPDTIPNFTTKYAIAMPMMYVVAFGIPVFAVWWQQSKLKTA
ncbi:hypothetical protein V8C86DRAFT_2795342 [Haematococcus lacustris]